MEDFGVGRPSVREALLTLERSGFVQLRSGSPAIVTRPTADRFIEEMTSSVRSFMSDDQGIRDLQAARQLVECAVARQTARMRTDADVARIRAAFEAQVAGGDDIPVFEERDVTFHAAIAANDPQSDLRDHPARVGGLADGAAPDDADLARPMEDRAGRSLENSTAPSSAGTPTRPRPQWPATSNRRSTAIGARSRPSAAERGGRATAAANPNRLATRKTEGAFNETWSIRTVSSHRGRGRGRRHHVAGGGGRPEQGTRLPDAGPRPAVLALPVQGRRSRAPRPRATRSRRSIPATTPRPSSRTRRTPSPAASPASSSRRPTPPPRPACWSSPSRPTSRS